jgi:hypothetical protein
MFAWILKTKPLNFGSVGSWYPVEGPHAEIRHGAAEKHGGNQPAVALVPREGVPANVEQLDVLAQLLELSTAEDFGDFRCVELHHPLGCRRLAVSALGREDVHRV